MEKGAKLIANIAGLLIVVFFTTILAFDAGKYPAKNRFGALSKVVSIIGETPSAVKTMLFELPEYLKATQEFAPPVNLLEEDIYALHTFGPTNEAKLINLRTDRVIGTWDLGEHKPYPNARYFAQLLPDSSLFAYVHEGDWAGVISSTNEVIWERSGDLVYHHSAEIQSGKIWICARDHGYLHTYGNATLDTFFINDSKGIGVMDEVILGLDLETGATTDSISMLEVFAKNELNPVYKSYYGPAHGDCFHLNDIQPVTFTDTILGYEMGDLLISNRTQNELLHLRPSTLEILHSFSEGLSSQHDVDILGDSAIICFNNHSPSLFDLQFSVENDQHEGIYSEVAAFDLSGNRKTELGISNQMTAEKIYTSTEGLQEFLGNGYVAIEEQNEFNVYIFKDDALVYKNALNYFGKTEYVEIPNWTRFYRP